MGMGAPSCAGAHVWGLSGDVRNGARRTPAMRPTNEGPKQALQPWIVTGMGRLRGHRRVTHAPATPLAPGRVCAWHRGDLYT